MNRVRPRFARGVENSFDAQVALRGGRMDRSSQASSATRTCRARASASEYTGGHAHAEALRGARHAAGDLAAVGDEQLMEHPCLCLSSDCPTILRSKLWGRQAMATSDAWDFDFGLGETLDEIRREVRRFATAEIAPLADEIDRTNEFPRALWPKLGEQGLLGVTVPERWGGSDLGYLAHTVIMEEISRASRRRRPELRRALEPVRESDPAQRHGCAARPLPPRLVSGEHVGALAMSEPGAGSDVVSMQLRAVKRGTDYVLTGRKMWITNGPDADVLVVYAKTEPAAGSRGITAFIVERGFKDFPPRRSSTSSACAAPARASSCSRSAWCPQRTCSGKENEGVRRADERARLRARGARGRAARPHERGAGTGAALRARAQTVRAPYRHLPARCRQRSRTCTRT